MSWPDNPVLDQDRSDIPINENFDALKAKADEHAATLATNTSNIAANTSAIASQGARLTTAEGTLVTQGSRVAAAEVTVGAVAPKAAPVIRPAIASVANYRGDQSALVQTTWTTPDGHGVVVHPSVLYFPAGKWGYPYWASATPYYNTDNQLENPCIFVSRDGNTWGPPPGLTNPLRTPPSGGYNSDVCLREHPVTGELLLFYRWYGSGTEQLSLMRSNNGISWSSDVILTTYSDAVARPCAPMIWFDAKINKWVMIATEIVADPRVLWRWTADAPEGPWARSADATVTPDWVATHSPWHGDVWPVGDALVMLMQEAIADGASGQRFFLLSNDSGLTWTRALKPVIPKWGYKSCFLPVMTPDGLAFDCWMGKTEGGVWGVERVLATPYAPAVDLNLAFGLARAGITPYILGDGFDRADSAGSLGTAPSGQTWTNVANTMSIVSGKAVAGSVANCRATINVGVSDYEFSAILVAAGTGQSWLNFRYVDSSNFFRLGIDTGSWRFERVTGGSVTILSPTTIHGSVGLESGSARFGARCIGDQITILMDGVPVFKVTDAQGQSATTIGLQATNPAKTFDDVTLMKVV